MKTFFEYKDSDFHINHTRFDNPMPYNYHMHTHDNTELFLFLRGSGVYHVEGSEYRLESGDVLIMRPSELHYIELDHSKPYERITLNFKTDLFSAIDTNGLLLKPINERKAGKLNQYKSYHFRNSDYRKYFTNMESFEGDIRTNIIANLLPLLNEIYHSYISRVEDIDANETLEYRIIRYINKHLDSDISLDSICERYYISKAQLCRIFKKATGTTVWQYITLKRLLLAKQLISLGENPTHIYTKCGFSDYSTFYRAYVKKFSVSPKEKN